MSQQFTLDIPDETVQQAEIIASQTGMAIETVLVETLKTSLPITGDWEAQLDKLSAYSDAQLWFLVSQRLTPVEDERRKSLVDQSKTQPLSIGEQSELDSILERIRQLMVLRSEALVLLKERGYEIEQGLN